MDPWDMIDLSADMNSDQPPHQPQPQPYTSNMVEQCAVDVGGKQPPSQLQSPLHPWSRPRPRSQPRPQLDARKLADEFFADTYGYQPPRSQPQLQPMQSEVWTREENKAFESVIATCFKNAMHNRCRLLAACLPGKTPAQLQRRFQKLMNDINAIHNAYIPNTPLNAPAIINATPPPPYYIHHQHHRAEVVAAAAEKAAPMEAAIRRKQNQSANTYKTKKSHWTEDEHRLFVRGYEVEGSKWSKISKYYVKTRTPDQVASHVKNYKIHKERLARGEKLRKSINDVI